MNKVDYGVKVTQEQLEIIKKNNEYPSDYDEDLYNDVLKKREKGEKK